MTDEIAITGIRATGYHGVYDHERRDGQEFVVDVVLSLSLHRAATTDDVTDTVHYGEFAERVAAIVTGEPVNLIETLAERIAGAALGYDAVTAVVVTVHKPQAPVTVAFGDIAVTVRRERPHTEHGERSA